MEEDRDRGHLANKVGTKYSFNKVIGESYLATKCLLLTICVTT